MKSEARIPEIRKQPEIRIPKRVSSSSGKVKMNCRTNSLIRLSGFLSDFGFRTLGLKLT